MTEAYWACGSNDHPGVALDPIWMAQYHGGAEATVGICPHCGVVVGVWTE